jgi:glycine/D-amino acid oxidase-like deaminating enzyme
MHPARLARGLADVVEASGVVLYEQSPAIDIAERRVRTPAGTLRARFILRAAEAYTDSIPSHERRLLPLHSMMIATEPLPEAAWQEMGMAQREVFGDPRRMVTYGQRTADDRLAFGCRGAYYYGSKIHDRFSDDSPVFRDVEKTVARFFPLLRDFQITHRWGGALGVPRDWRPRVGLDRNTGFAWAGGYVGEGVAASNLAGRTLADLILERDSDLVRLPLVGPDFHRWEREPLRWLGVESVRRLGDSLDNAELEGESTPRLRGALFDAIVHK